jgi:hypothetical protein
MDVIDWDAMRERAAQFKAELDQPGTMRVYWCDEDRAGSIGHGDVVSRLEELDAKLDQISNESADKGYAFAVHLTMGTREAGSILDIGIGGAYSFLRWNQKERSWFSRGTVECADLVFEDYVCQGGSWDRNLIENEVAREAAREFLRAGGQRPTCVEWE